MEKKDKKLAKLLAKYGLDDDKIAGIIEEVNKPEDEEVVADDPEEKVEVEETPSDEKVEEAEEVAEVEAQVDEPTETEEVKQEEQPAEVIDDTKTDGEEDKPEVQEDVIEEKAEQDIPPVEDAQPQIETQPSEVAELRNQLVEYQKAVDGLVARFNSLEDMLKNSGTIQIESVNEQTNPVGIDESSTPANEKGETLQDVLAFLNKHR